jgi:hypothetical protein
MKKLFVIWAFLAAGAAYAGCSQNSYYYNGKMIICTTCCDSYGNNCNTFCN